jgi:small neutral amino acid transporter SnatA (MarC family)
MATLIVALPMMFFVFGLIPINEVMTARYTAPEYRTRVYAVRYTFAFIAIAAAVPVVSWFHGAYGGFTELFAMLAGLSVLLTGFTLMFAAIERRPASRAEPVSA